MGPPRKNITSELNLLEDARSLSDGWSVTHLKQVQSAAEDLKCSKTTAHIQAIVKKTAIAKLNGECSTLSHKLFELNPSTKLLRSTQSYIVVEVPVNFRLPRIPLGYAFKGGAARLALLNVLGIDTRRLQARDFDLVRYAKGSVEDDRRIARRVMSEDFSHGHGVEVVESLEHYFDSRDLTINEVLLTGKKLLMSWRAFDDGAHSIIRPSQHLLKQPRTFPGVTACKALRFAAEFHARGLNWILAELPEGVRATEREIALHAARAAESGALVEKQFQALCREFIVPVASGPRTSASSKPNRKAFPASRLRSAFPKRRTLP